MKLLTEDDPLTTESHEVYDDGFTMSEIVLVGVLVDNTFQLQLQQEPWSGFQIFLEHV